MLPPPDVLSKFIEGILGKCGYAGCDLSQPLPGGGCCLTIYARNLKAALGPKGQKLEELRLAVRDHFALRDLEAFASQPGGLAAS